MFALSASRLVCPAMSPMRVDDLADILHPLVENLDLLCRLADRVPRLPDAVDRLAGVLPPSSAIEAVSWAASATVSVEEATSSIVAEGGCSSRRRPVRASRVGRRRPRLSR